MLKQPFYYISIGLYILYRLIIPTSSYAQLKYYDCGGGPCNNIWGCMASYTCDTTTKLCGLPYSYDACSGSTCTTYSGIDTSSPCQSSTSTCSPVGTTRTSYWDYFMGCTSNCGTNTRIGRCVANNENDCNAPACTNPAGTVGSMYTDTTSCGCYECEDCTPACGQTKNCGGSCPTTSIGTGYSACSATCGNGTKTDVCGNTIACCLECQSCTPACGQAKNCGGGTCPTTDAYVYGSCSVSCGAGTQSDQCGHSIACCINQGVQSTPSVSTSPGTCNNVNFTWTFPDTTGCGNAWGYRCAGNTNTFRILVDGTQLVAGLDSSTRSYSMVSTTGSHSVAVCASNGYNEVCSGNVAYSVSLPTCSVSGLSPTANTCTSTVPTFYSTIGSCANQQQFYLSTDNITYNPSSGWITGGSWTDPSLGTGTYYWGSKSQSTASPPTCNTPANPSGGYAFRIDKTAPPAPVLNLSSSIDSDCVGKRKITASWSTVTDIGCSGTVEYRSQASTDVGFGSVLTDWSNTWQTGVNSEGSSDSYFGGTTIYAHVKSRDTLDNQSSWTSTDSITIPIPSPYPTIHLTGSYVEDMNGSCASMNVDPSSLTITLTGQAGMTSTCTPQASSYSCDLTYHNQDPSYACLVPDGQVQIAANYPVYNPITVHENNECTGLAGNTIQTSHPDNNLYFTYPTNGSGANLGWYKFKNTSWDNLSDNVNLIPHTVTAFDSDDDASRLCVAGESGVVTNANLGPANDGIYSSTNWFNTHYTRTNRFNVEQYVEYMKSRKKYTEITVASDITKSGVYLWKGDSAPNLSEIPNFPVVLIVQNQKVVISQNNTHTSLAVLVTNTNNDETNIQIGPDVTALRGIFIAPNISVDESTNTNAGLKVTGNLIATNAFTNNRSRTDNTKPVLFVAFDPTQYAALLPYISIGTYDWKQIQ